MALNREKPSLFELMHGGRPDDASASDASQAADENLEPSESAPGAEWLQDVGGGPIAVVDDEETRRILDELGLTLIAEQTAPDSATESEVQAPLNACEISEDIGGSVPSEESVVSAPELGLPVSEDLESCGAEMSVETATDVAVETESPAVAREPRSRGAGRRRIVPDLRATPGVSDSSTQPVFAGRFLPERGPVPRSRWAAERESVEQASIFGPREEAETPRRLIRSDTLAAALGSALLLLALAFLVGRVSARDGDDQAGPVVAPAAGLARRAVAAPLEVSAATANQIVEEAASLAAVSAPVAPTPVAAAPVAPSDDRPYHVRVVTTTRATAADIVEFLNKHELVRSRGLKVYSRKVRSNTVVYIGSFASSSDPTAQRVCDFVKTVSFNGRQDFGGAVIRRKV